MRKALFILCVVVVFVLTGCKTSETVAVTPEPIDISPQKQILFDTKPKNDYDIILDVQTIDDVVHNSGQYLKAWQQWETYALGLEDFIDELESLLST